MRKDDSKNAVPASATPETDTIDSSWEDPDLSTEIEIMEAEESLEELLGEESIHERVTAPPDPNLSVDGEYVLESGFHEREPPTEPLEGLEPPRVPTFDGPPMQPVPILTQRARMPSVQLDDPLAHFDTDLDTETPSGHPIPISDRVTPVHAPPAALLALDLDVPPASDEEPAARDLKERYAVGDFSGALEIAEHMLKNDPDDLDAKRYAQSCRDVLIQMYTARMGALNQIVSVSLPSDQIRWLSLDHRAGFLLSLVDGTSSIEEILDVSGMPRLVALKILYTLLEQRVISLSPRE